MPGIKIEIKGIEQLRAKLQGLPRHAQDAFEDALLKEATGIMSAAQKTVPVLTGRLRSSARVTSERRGYKSAIVLAYDTYYAVFVHAKTKWADGRKYGPSHWLQRAAEKANKGLSGRLIRAVRTVLKGSRYAR